MKWSTISQAWTEFGVKAKRQWVELEDEQIAEIQGARELLADRLQECYGISRNDAEREIDDWLKAFGDCDAAAFDGAGEMTDTAADTPDVDDRWPKDDLYREAISLKVRH